MSVTVAGRIEKVYGTRDRWASVLIAGRDGKRYRAAGRIIGPAVGYDITVTGEDSIHAVYGPQIEVAKASVSQPTSEPGMVNYLTGFMKGVGHATAVKIVREFGPDTFFVIEGTPQLLTRIPGITKAKAEAIHRCHMEYKEYKDFVDFFGERATSNQIQKIHAVFKAEGLKRIKENPYIIIYEVDGIGFAIADRLALSSGMKPDDSRRIGAAIVHLLKNIASEGHCFCRLENLEGLLEKQIPGLPLETVSDVLVTEIQKGTLFLVDEEKLYWAEIYKAEQNCATFIKEMLNSGPMVNTTPAILNEVIREFERQTGLELEQKQREAIFGSVQNRVSVITGGPGSGKTTIIKGLIQAWQEADTALMRKLSGGSKVTLCASTGKAARRMAELTGMEASTIHRFIFQDDLEERSLIVVDEASMLDLLLAARLLRKAVSHHCQIVFVGDADQLSPIGPGSFFTDIIKSPVVPTVTLDVIHRNSGAIAKNAQRINYGNDILSFTIDSTFRFIPVEKDEAQQTVIESYLDLVKQFGLENVLCAVPISQKMKSATSSGVLNDIIRDRVNPITPKTITLPGCSFRANDRVMYLENNDDMDISNGDCGTVDRVDLEEKRIIVRFDNGKTVEMTVDDSKNMNLAYAMSTHKAQGSEFKAVVVVQCWHDYYMLRRDLLYTAVTRARDKVVLIGDYRAVRAALRNMDDKRRNTRLYELLNKEEKPF